ncbi:TetR/AcrR family transcriptional regulator [Castellaniella sp.]|uniref:TetR/AcrR family transcriptional regulator n=1 Tax=Castellaniella sp. TaxID=1955812 RepID=UPI0035660931
MQSEDHPHGDRPVSARSRAPRLRLTPEERVPQILDAALAAFSRQGFAATRMDDIARQAGLSKGGLYAHFDSKDAIFKALLDRSLNRMRWEDMPQLAAGASSRAVAEWVVNQLDATVLAPDTVAIVQLLIPERARVPLRVNEWKNSVGHLRATQVAGLIAKNLASGPLRGSVLARHPWLALSPAIHVLLWRVLFGPDSAPDPDFRQAHIDLLCELLAVRPDTRPPT